MAAVRLIRPTTRTRRSLISAPCHCCRAFANHNHTRHHSTHQAAVHLPDAPARTRFAPSPTGYLHLGSLRTALFNYLLAKKTGGQFVLRIEDTDSKRTVGDAATRIYRDLQWAGLQWDEGPDVSAENSYLGQFGPYHQSQRTALYQEHANKLLDSGHAYRCFCSEERLQKLAEQRKKLGLPTDYDRECANIPQDQVEMRVSRGDPFVVRLLAPKVYPDFHDLVYGKVGKDQGDNAGITVKYGEIAYEDPILLKSDGTPTYHLANVVDDHAMQISHVVRATEWMSSTPKHLELYKAFGWEPPKYAHVPLLTNDDRHKLSKRASDQTVASFRDQGILPDALTNFVTLLGWSHSQRSDIMDLQQLIDNFTMKFTKGNAIVDLDKLWYLQRAHFVRAAKDETPEFADLVDRTATAAAETFHVSEGPDGSNLQEYTRQILRVDANNFTTPKAFCDRYMNFYMKPVWTPFQNRAPHIARTPHLMRAAKSLCSTDPTEWTAEQLSVKMKAIIAKGARTIATNEEFPDEKSKEKAWNKAFCGYLRWILLSGHRGPSLAATMEILGSEVCQFRVEEAIRYSFRPD